MPDEIADPTAPSTETAEEKAERWKFHSRKNENEKKAAITELNTIREQLTAATARADSLAAANAEAVEKAKADTLVSTRTELVKVHASYAAKARGVDPEALLEGRDLTGFVAEDGSVKADAIDAWVAKISPNGGTPPKPVDFGGGPRGGEGVPASGNAYADDPLYQALKSISSE